MALPIDQILQTQDILIRVHNYLASRSSLTSYERKLISEIAELIHEANKYELHPASNQR